MSSSVNAVVSLDSIILFLQGVRDNFTGFPTLTINFDGHGHGHGHGHGQDAMSSNTNNAPAEAHQSAPSPNSSPEGSPESTAESGWSNNLNNTEAARPGAYERVGINILKNDRGCLSEFGYFNVRHKSIQKRRDALMEASTEMDVQFIQERLFQLAAVQLVQNPNPFRDDLKWFEEAHHLSAYE